MKPLKCNICLKYIESYEISFINEQGRSKFLICKDCSNKIAKLPSKEYYCSNCKEALIPGINCSEQVIIYFKCIELYKILHNKQLIILDVEYKCLNCSLKTISNTVFNKEIKDLKENRIQQIQEGSRIIESFKKTKI